MLKTISRLEEFNGHEMSLKELVTSADFCRYRKEQVRTIVEYIRPKLFKGEDLDKLAGALEMANRLIRLPEEVCTDKEAKLQIDKAIQEDYARIVVEMVREVLRRNKHNRLNNQPFLLLLYHA